MIIGNHYFDTDKQVSIMGILNVTPDSFSDGGKWKGMDAVLAHTEQMIREGATIIDVGGESTRPGYQMISEQEEIERICDPIEQIKTRFDIVVSVDTYKGAVAKAALEAGADMVNDIWGLKYDPSMAGVIAGHQAACCLMHNRREASYQSFLDDMLSDLEESVRIAKEAGISGDKIILDPGVGFAKSYEQNLAAIHHVGRIGRLGYPILLGTSRKSVIGLALDLPVEEREIGTAVTTVFAVCQRCSFVRVHDVETNRRAIRMAQAILGAE